MNILHWFFIIKYFVFGFIATSHVPILLIIRYIGQIFSRYYNSRLTLLGWTSLVRSGPREFEPTQRYYLDFFIFSIFFHILIFFSFIFRLPPASDGSFERVRVSQQDSMQMEPGWLHFIVFNCKIKLNKLKNEILIILKCNFWINLIFEFIYLLKNKIYIR